MITFLHILYYLLSLEKPINTGISDFFRDDYQVVVHEFSVVPLAIDQFVQLWHLFGGHSGHDERLFELTGSFRTKRLWAEADPIGTTVVGDRAGSPVIDHLVRRK